MFQNLCCPLLRQTFTTQLRQSYQGNAKKNIKTSKLEVSIIDHDAFTGHPEFSPHIFESWPCQPICSQPSYLASPGGWSINWVPGLSWGTYEEIVQLRWSTSSPCLLLTHASSLSTSSHLFSPYIILFQHTFRFILFQYTLFSPLNILFILPHLSFTLSLLLEQPYLNCILFSQILYPIHSSSSI